MKFLAGVLLTLFIFFNIFTGSAMSQEETEFYHLGVALPLTGSGAFYSKDAINAIQLAGEEINARGGLLGKYPVKLFFRDTRTNPDAAVREVTAMIIHNKVRCILGTYSSACAIAVKPIVKEHGVLHIASISNSENITMTDFSPYTFLMVPNTYMQANAAVLGVVRLAKEKGWKNYATIASDYEWGRSAQENFAGLLKKAMPDLILKKKFWTRLGETEFSSYIEAIAKLRPDFVYGALASRDNMIWMNTAGASDFFKKNPYPASLISVSELIAQAETIPRGLVGICRAPFFAHMDIPMMAEFVENFKAMYEQYPSDWAVMAYDSVYALKQGIEKAGTADSEKVKDAMKGMSLETTRGKLSFRELDNQLNCSSYIGEVADDPKYPFPIYKDLIEIKGADSWRPDKEIEAERDN